MASGKPTGAPRATGPDEARRTKAGPPGTPERHAAGHNQGTRTGAKQQRPPGAANPGGAHNTQRTTAQGQVPRNTKPTHHKPQPGVAGYKQSAHTSTHTPRHPSQEWRGAAETRAQANTPEPHTPVRSGGVQAERAHKHTQAPTPGPGVAGRSRNRSPSTHTHTAHPSQERGGTSGARTQAHTHPDTAASGGAQRKPEPKHTHPHHTPQPGLAGYKQSAHQAHTHPNTPTRSGGALPKLEPKHKHSSRTPQPGVAGYKRSAHTSTHTPRQPSQEWWGAAETRAQAHTPTPHTPARSGGVRAECAHKHTLAPTPGPGVAGRSRNPSPSTHTHTAYPSQEWRGTSGARTQTHTHTQHPAGVAGRSGTRAQAHAPTPHTPARRGRVQAEQAHNTTHTPHTPARSGVAQPKPEPKHARAHRAPEPGVAGYKRSAHTNTHTPQHPSYEWRGAAETRAQAHAPTPHTPARSGGVQAERAHKHTHTPTPQPGVAGHSRNPTPSTHSHSAHPSHEWRGTSGARTQTRTLNTQARKGAEHPQPEPKDTRPHGTPQPGVAGHKRGAHQAHTPPNTPARSGGAQPKPEPKHTHPHRTPQPGVAGYKRSARTSTRTPQHPSQEWRGAAETRAQAHPPTPHTPARSGGVQAERAHKHTHTPTTRPGVAGRSRNTSPSTLTHTAHPSQEWRGTSRARTQTHTGPNTPARNGGVQPKPEPKHTHPHRTPQPGVAGYKRSGHTSTHRPQHPSQEWRGAAETRAQAHIPTTHAPGRTGGVQAERAHKLYTLWSTGLISFTASNLQSTTPTPLITL